MTVRPAEDKDAEKIVELGHVMHKESVFADYDFDKDHLINYTFHAIRSPKEFGMFVNEDNDGEINGAVCGYIGSHYFAPKVKVAYDFIVYVHPSKRGGIAAVRLLKKYEEWAKRAGASEIVFGVSAGINNDKAEKFYRGLGYDQSAAVFKKEM
tara:strand:- start:1036 stop:1494 length:459 start_codon:yes stop_codon:yes gene_type:complete